ncbi:MAG: tetratricopeptide repeat protein [Bacteroidota bacterium]
MKYLLLLVFLQSNLRIDSLQEALSEAEDFRKVSIYAQLSKEVEKNDLDSAKYYAKLALRHSEEQKLGLFETCRRLGDLHYLSGSFDSSINYFNRALNEIESKQDSTQHYLIKSSLAKSLRQLGRFDEAVEVLIECSKYYQDQKDILGIATTNNTLGGVFYYLEETDKALEYYKKSLEGFEVLGNKKGIANITNNIGALNKQKKDYEKALEYYYKSLEIDRELGNKRGQAIALNNIGFTLNYLKRYKEALNSFNLAYAIDQEIARTSGHVYSLHGLGESHYFLGNYDKSIEYLLKGIQLAEDYGSVYERYDLYHVLSLSYKEKQNYRKAFLYDSLKSNVQDSIFDYEKTQLTMDLQEKYNSEKKDKEIQILNREKKIQNLEIENKNNLVLFLVSLLIIFLAAAFILIKLNRSRKKALEAVSIKNEELAQQNEEIATQRDQIELQSEQLTSKSELVLESIRYAKQIQEAILPSYATILDSFQEFFVFYKPRDIVSGDFYWISNRNDKVIIAAADCTGHGIPGAFMSMIGNELLNELVIEKKIIDPGEILMGLDRGIVRTLRQETNENLNGMDIGLCIVDKKAQTISFAGAKNPMIEITKEQEIKIFKGDRHAIGGIFRLEKSFKVHANKLNTDSVYYLMSDGFQDQFGGTRDKKYSTKRLRSFLLKINHLPLKDQKIELEQEFNTWQGTQEQIDDVMILGFRS